jgi:hypothetical protein
VISPNVEREEAIPAAIDPLYRTNLYSGQLRPGSERQSTVRSRENRHKIGRRRYGLYVDQRTAFNERVRY